jgi:endogenous inhibitor of DNA gyrase (YacG/DUF329 family)
VATKERAGASASGCPICGATFVREQVARVASARAQADPFPFCSTRCQLVDLGRWLGEDYKIADGEDQSGGGVDGAPAAGERP